MLLPGDLREYRKAETNLIAWLREHAGTEAARRASRAEQLVRVGELKKLAGLAKRKAVFDWIENVTILIPAAAHGRLTITAQADVMWSQQIQVVVR